MDKMNAKKQEELLTDYFTGNISENDAQELKTLLKTDEAFQTKFNEMNKVYSISVTPAVEYNKDENFKKLMQRIALSEPQTVKPEIIEKPESKNITLPSNWFKKLGRIAAIIAFMLTISVSTFYITRNIIADKYNQNYTETIVPLGSQTRIVLPDGSIAWLNAGSTLKYNQNFGTKTREVILKGEGYFEVTKDASKPFLVRTNALDIKVLGTVFDVVAYEEDATVEVNLLRGAVHVSFQNNKNKSDVDLKPNERLVFNKQTGNVNTSTINASRSALWKTGRLYFENETVEQITNKLERKYNVTICIDDRQIKKETFTGSLNLNLPLREVISYIDVDKKFIFKQVGDTIRIDKK